MTGKLCQHPLDQSTTSQRCLHPLTYKFHNSHHQQRDNDPKTNPFAYFALLSKIECLQTYWRTSLLTSCLMIPPNKGKIPRMLLIDAKLGKNNKHPTYQAIWIRNNNNTTLMYVNVSWICSNRLRFCEDRSTPSWTSKDDAKWHFSLSQSFWLAPTDATCSRIVGKGYRGG